MNKVIISTTSFYLLLFMIISSSLFSQGTRLLRQPALSDDHIAFAYASDIWVADRVGQNVTRITSTQAIEGLPQISPDGKTIAFTSNRSGNSAVYTVSIEGGTPTQLTWLPGGASVRDWSPDGASILFASARGTAPARVNYLWKVSKDGGPASRVSSQWGFNAKYSPDGKKLIVDRVSRWDSEWRLYRGGQNTPLIVLDLQDNSEILIPNEQTSDIQPVWHNDDIYFISDRDGTSNIWQFVPATKSLNQVTAFTGSDVKTLAGHNGTLIYEREGLLHLYDIGAKTHSQVEINIIGDFPWAEDKWEDVSKNAQSVSLSATGKRLVMEARGEIFTVPAKDGAPRNLTKSSGTADRRPIWSPKGDQIAYFSDAGGKGYTLMLQDQSGMKDPVSINIGTSKLGWEPTWSPDGERIAFVDDDTWIQIVNLKDKSIKGIGHAGNNLDRGNMNLAWSPDSKWLAYNTSGANNLRKIMVWEVGTASPKRLTDEFADAVYPTWDRDGKHLYFAASTDVALGSGWANTSSMQADPEYATYVINLTSEETSPFEPKSDEEEVKEEEKEDDKKDKKKDKKKSDKDEDDKKDSEDDKKGEEEMVVKIDFDNLIRRILPLPLGEGNFEQLIAGPEGSVFIAESKPGSQGLTIHKFTLKDGEAKEFITGAGYMSMSSDGKKLLSRISGTWNIMDASGGSGKGGESIKVNLKMNLDRGAEWKQIFEETWRYERDYFYDPNIHGRDWDDVYVRYSPLVPYVKHRADLNYILDQINGELSVGHSFVGGGDYPDVEDSKMGLLGADLVADKGRWKIKRIYTTEAWNPGLSGPLDRPGTKIKNGYYLVGVNGVELKSTDNPYKHFDGTAGEQTIIHINDKPSFEGAWQETVEPIGSDNGLRQRAWVEDNRRLVDSLSGGKLAYIWVPNTSGNGIVSFNRYFFAQQDKLGAVIDERFNGGGLLDDYMVDNMTRTIRAAITNEVPNGAPMKLPAGILGPKVLLINEMAGSGGDFFPWVFRQQNAGKLIGRTTWGGLVKSSTHYRMIDGGRVTCPDNAIFDPVKNEWVGENKGIAPDIFVRQDAISLSQGRDPQLERAVKELMDLLPKQAVQQLTPPKFLTPAKGK
ncbi:MAG: tricorn protease [Saprospiraceae bacterium]|jgi:tricorn protease